MNTAQILVEAYQRGRAWNPDPAYQNLLNLDPTAIAKMNGSEPDAKLLLKSLQESDLNYNALVLAFHGRTPEFDGEIGPATASLVDIPRCPVPDFAPPPGAKFNYDDPELQSLVESMQENASVAATSGTGSWPATGCDPNRLGVHSMRVRIDTRGAPARVMGYLDQALAASTACYAEMGLSVRYILDATSAAELRKTFRRLGRGIIGYTYFPTPGTCNRISGSLSSTWAPQDFRLWAWLETHETGHGCGLNHTRGGIMNPTSTLVWPLTFIGDPSEARMRRFFGGVPLPPLPAPVSPAAALDENWQA